MGRAAAHRRLALTFLYPLVLIARAALVGDAGAIDLRRVSVGASLARVSQCAHQYRPDCARRDRRLSGVWAVTLALILAFVPFPGCDLCGAADRHVHRAADLPGDARLHVSLRIGRHAERRADAIVRLERAAGSLSLLGLGRDPRGSHGLYAVRAAAAACGFLACRPEPDRSRRSAWARGPGGSCAASFCLPRFPPRSPAAASACCSPSTNSAIVLFIGAKGVITLPLLIYDKAIQESDYQAACAIAIGQYRALARPVRRSIASPPGGLEADAHAGLVALRPFRRMAPRSFAHRRRFSSRRSRSFSPRVWPGSGTASCRPASPSNITQPPQRRLGRRRVREPHHRARREPARASLRIVGGARSARSRRGMEPDAWACCSSFRAPCRRCRWGWASWSRSASGRCSSTARRRSSSSPISC